VRGRVVRSARYFGLPVPADVNVEAPFPQPMRAWLTIDPREVGPKSHGWIEFIDPKHHEPVAVPVTTGSVRKTPIYRPDGRPAGLMPLWHIDIGRGDGGELLAVTTPDVHRVGEWHAPDGARWVIVSQLEAAQI
jgi:hypothetical protein